MYVTKWIMYESYQSVQFWVTANWYLIIQTLIKINYKIDQHCFVFVQRTMVEGVT